MKTKLCPLALLLVLGPAAVRAAAPLDLADVERRLERASRRGDVAAVSAAATEIETAHAGDPQNPALRYLRGFACYATANAQPDKQHDPAVLAQLEKAADLLRQVHGDPWAAEAAGLASSVYGQLIGLSRGATGMTLGPQAADLLATATRDAPQSPRVLYFRGLSKFNTPVEWGGNPTEGLKLLQQAVDAFAKQAADVPGPHWGHAAALTWLGIAQQKTGDLDAARAAWTQALALEPEYAWVKYVLLPSLESSAKPAS